MKFIPEQEAVFDAVRSDANVAVRAVAGSGKTTTIVEAAKYAPGRVAFVAFNVHIVEELRPRLPQNVEARTAHSLGLRILRQYVPDTKMEDKENRKYRTIFRDEYPQAFRVSRNGRPYVLDQWSGVLPGVDYCRTQLLDPDDDADWDEVESYLFAQGEEVNPQTRDAVTAVLRRGLAATGVHDFLDMLYLPVAHGWVSRQTDTLFADEAQDFSPLQQKLVTSVAHRVVFVGDPRQAIMGFAGADTQSFANLTATLAGWKNGCVSLPLPVCWRCPTSGVDLARILVPDMRAAPTAKPGLVLESSLGEAVAALRPDDLLVCRYNGPLARIALSLIKNDTPVLVRGKAFGDGLTNLTFRLSKGADSIKQFRVSLSQWRRDQIEALDPEDDGEAIAEVSDRADTLECLVEVSSSVSDLKARLARLFSDDSPKGKVVLSSIHRSKGLEARNVTVLDPGAMPRGYGESRMQEENLLYVALTRHKERLTLVDHKSRRTLPTQEWLEAVAAGGTARQLTVQENDEC